MKKLNLGILFFVLFFKINTLFCTDFVKEIRNTPKTDETKIKQIAEAIEKENASSGIKSQFKNKFGKAFTEYLVAPTTKNISTAPEYDPAKNAFDAFSADRTNKTLAKTFINAYNAVNNVAANYTGKIPDTWTNLLSTAKSVAAGAPPPPPRNLKDQLVYKTAETAYTNFSANQKDKNLAQKFIDAYEALDQVKGSYTGSIPSDWTNLLSKAKSVVTAADPAAVMKANEDAAELADKVVAKIKAMPTGQLSNDNKKDMAAKWTSFSQAIIADFQ